MWSTNLSMLSNYEISYIPVVAVGNRDGSSNSTIKHYRRNTWITTKRRWPRKT